MASHHRFFPSMSSPSTSHAAGNAILTSDNKSAKDVRVLFTPIDETINSNSLEKKELRMDVISILCYLTLTIAILAVSCTALVGSLASTTDALGNNTFLVAIIIPAVSSSLSTISFSASVSSVPPISSSKYATHSVVSMDAAVYHALHTSLTLLLVHLPLLQLFSMGKLIYSQISPVCMASMLMTLLAVTIALPSGHSNWMIGVTLLCVYLALVIVSVAHVNLTL